MNQPTREEFEQLKEQVKRIEQQTEPISLKIERGLPIPEATLLQKIMEMVGRQAPDIGALKGDVSALRPNVDTLKQDMDKVKADILQIRESQADFRDTLKTTATKDDVASIKNDVSRLETIMLQILNRLPQTEGE